MTCGVYKIGFSNTDKVYVGSSKNIERRLKQHKVMLNTGQHHSYKLQEYYNNNKDCIKFSILCECKGRDRTIIEAEYVSKYNSISNWFNVAEVNGFECAHASLLRRVLCMPNYLMLCTKLLDEGLSHTDVIITSYMFNNYETCTQYGIDYSESAESIAENTRSSVSIVKETIRKLIEKGIAELKDSSSIFNVTCYDFDINYFMDDFIRQSFEC